MKEEEKDKQQSDNEMGCFEEFIKPVPALSVSTLQGHQ